MRERAAIPGWPRALREPLAAAYVGLSCTTFRQVVAPAVPAIRLTPGCVAWLREDLDSWLHSRRPSADAPAGEGQAPPETTHDPIAAALANLAPSRRARRSRAQG